MDPLRLFILLSHLRLQAKKLEHEARQAEQREDFAETLVLFGAAQAYHAAARDVEEAANSPAEQGERHLELLTGERD